ncbi:hypothetical protein SPRG_12061 [Saprolegnia parasitica CBS 223.65]|uniref:EF-hand domain-containing protein n=1 Tax=Saprolegnia parasitica (strain CBS 223.65) TaxID=695850 RepID=A0A067BU70_SAPPC|nr:hypothetical protein SPRG_12061 [Saprolegnia parasitica CBS 223.65]KDO22074.1 hypothetical protein SPRG_12061 [Saprolegnia parasitica CBS 223.65]|eukprot:XP_012207217.1 hypothetical protein SPRG_12061 [Saprolegnia parasitica CBS 223.65]
MLTLLPVEAILHFRTRFLSHSTDDAMSKDAFLSIPVVAINPLRERLWSLFELTPTGDVAFPAFVAVMAVFTYHSSKDAKLRASFKLHDFDGDGRISKADLLAYLCLVADSGDKTDETEKDLDMVVTRTMEEVSSDGTAEFLSFDDFARVVN